MPRVIAVLVILACTIAALAECVQTPSPRLLPRWTWLLVILLLPIIGPVAWFLAGRVSRRSELQRSSPVSPDDDPRFMRELGDEVWRRKQRERRGEPPDPSATT